MSLKAVHIFFIVLSIALSLFFGIWASNHYRGNGGGAILAVSGLLAVFLSAYLIRFVKKAKQL
jgi:hypothetical protein